MDVELRGITKRFGSLVANDQIDLVVDPAEIGDEGSGERSDDWAQLVPAMDIT